MNKLLRQKIELGVNIDHVATLRQQRRDTYPDPLEAAMRAEAAGADIITLHLREDRRHIQDADVRALRPKLRTRMNLECAVTNEMLDIACEVRPHDVCLVPENRHELTTEGGLNVANNHQAVAAAVTRLHSVGVRASLFINADCDQVKAAALTGAKVVELHTGPYAQALGPDIETELNRVIKAVKTGLTHGLRINAGHGLNYENVLAIASIDGISELNIGHSIIARAVFDGLDKSIHAMKALLVHSRTPRRGVRE